jgi:hypothetical protein
VNVLAVLSLLATLASTGRPSPLAAVSAQACTPVHLAIDTTGANSAVPCFDSRGFGEVILCPDTVVSSITYWQPPYRESFEYYARLYVMAADSTGQPFPTIYYIGTIIHGVDADTLRPSPIVFAFTPALVLPGVGRYLFLVKADDGLCGGDFWLLGDTTNRYADGAAWDSGQFCDPRAPGSIGPGQPGFDLIFDIEFCDTHTTPALRATWGSLKSRYR